MLCVLHVFEELAWLKVSGIVGLLGIDILMEVGCGNVGGMFGVCGNGSSEDGGEASPGQDVAH